MSLSSIFNMDLTAFVFALLCSVLFCGTPATATTSPSTYLELATIDYQYTQTGINLTGRSAFVFQVKTSGHSFIALLFNPSDYYQSMMEMNLGFGDQVVIRNAVGGAELASFTLLDGPLYDMVTPTAVWLWISWAGGVLNMGRGTIPGQNYLMTYPDASWIAKIKTVSVTSFNGFTANWTIPLEQPFGDVPQPNVGDGKKDILDHDKATCRNREYPPKNSSVRHIALQLNLDERTSVRLRTVTYTSLVQLNVYINGIPFSVSGFNTGPMLNIKRNGGYTVQNMFPSWFNASTASGKHWVSWANGMLAVGWGDVVGQKTLAIHYENKPLVVNNLTVLCNGSLNVRYGYYLGLTALTRKSTGPLVQDICMRKVLTDKCVRGCLLETIENSRCTAVFCARKCLLNPRCTAFCLEPSTFPGDPCNCTLQAQPGVPVSSALFITVAGGSYYEVIN